MSCRQRAAVAAAGSGLDAVPTKFNTGSGSSQPVRPFPHTPGRAGLCPCAAPSPPSPRGWRLPPLPQPDSPVLREGTPRPSPSSPSIPSPFPLPFFLFLPHPHRLQPQGPGVTGLLHQRVCPEVAKFGDPSHAPSVSGPWCCCPTRPGFRWLKPSSPGRHLSVPRHGCPRAAGMVLPRFALEIFVNRFILFLGPFPIWNRSQRHRKRYFLSFLCSLTKSRQILFSCIGAVSNFDRSDFLQILKERSSPLPKRLRFLVSILSETHKPRGFRLLFLPQTPWVRGMLTLNL